jgi:Spx/MgsR family transcriptional regulator
MIQVYGISNCDTVKKALAWLKENDIAFEFHDFKKEGITTDKLKEWLKISFLEKIVNKKSIAFKNLTPEEKLRTDNKSDAIKLMQSNTNLIKRPVIEIAGTILNGFHIDEFQKAFGKK